MYDRILEEIRKKLEDASGESINPSELKASPTGGIACTASFRLAGKLKKNPKETAESIAERIHTGGFIKTSKQSTDTSISQ